MGDGATADRVAVRGELVQQATDHPAIVDARVLEKVLVLRRQHGPDQQRRDVLVGDRRPFHLAEFGKQPAVAAIDL